MQSVSSHLWTRRFACHSWTRWQKQRKRSPAISRPVRLRYAYEGRDPQFVVINPVEQAGEDSSQGSDTTSDDWSTEGSATVGSFSGDEGGMARINLRMPEHLKARVDLAAAREGLSVNAWLVRAAAATVERGDPANRLKRRGPQGAQRFTGWAR